VVVPSPLDVDYTPEKRHQVGFVSVWARAASAWRVVVGGGEVAFLARRRPGGHVRVVLTERAQTALFSGRTGWCQAGCPGSQVCTSRYSHQVCAETDAVLR